MFANLNQVLIKTDLRLLNAETASVYLKVSVVKKMRHLIRFSIALINLILKPSAKLARPTSVIQKNVYVLI